MPDDVQSNHISDGPSGGKGFSWIDSLGRDWQIEADPEHIALEHGSMRIDIARGDFARDLYCSPAAGRTVVRFSGDSEDIGFLVTAADFELLMQRIQCRPETPDQAQTREAKEASARRSIWPKMTAVSIWALMLASLAFLPFVGVAFAVGAAVLLLIDRRRHRPNAANTHIRVLGTVSWVWLAWGVGVCMLSSWTWIHPIDSGVLAAASVSTGDGEHNWTVGILALLVVLISLSVHEAAHAISAWWCGDDYARSLGRVTLNPLAHIDPFGTVILPALLFYWGGPVFGFAKPVPVRLSGVRRFRRAHILISIAGPGSNLLLAALALSMLFAAGCVLRPLIPAADFATLPNLWELQVTMTGFAGAEVLSIFLCGLKLAVMVNLFLAAFNMIPIPPLDGSWVLEHLFPMSLGRFYAAIRPYGIIIFLGLLWSDALTTLLLPAIVVMSVISEIFSRCLLG